MKPQIKYGGTGIFGDFGRSVSGDAFLILLDLQNELLDGIMVRLCRSCRLQSRREYECE